MYSNTTVLLQQRDRRQARCLDEQFTTLFSGEKAMSIDKDVQADERTVAVVNASNSWVLAFIPFALLIDAFCRAAFFHEAAWDLYALACVPGLIAMIYEARQGIWGRRIWRMRLIVALATAVVAGLIAFILAITKVK